MIAYKFLGPDAVGLYSGFQWPMPAHGQSGRWIEVQGDLVAGVNGIHAVTVPELVNWLDEELWVVELAGLVETREGVLLAQRGRLLQLVESWNADAASEFTAACVLSARDQAAGALARAGREQDSTALRASTDPGLLQTRASTLAPEVDETVAEALLYLADSIELARGGRPDRYDTHPAALTAPTPSAISANLGFAAAHAAGCAAAHAHNDPALYDAGYQHERDRQQSWLTTRLAL